MRLATYVFSLVVCTALLSQGCQPNGPAGGAASTQPTIGDSDPVVVSAEKATEAAFIAIDTFLRIAYDNRATLPEPVRALAERLTREAPQALRDARSATQAYAAATNNSASRDTSALEARLTAVQELARQARLALSQLKR